MEQRKVELERDGPVATITLNRPEARNALSPQMLEEMDQALDKCRAGDVRAVVLTGNGGAFCSGADVRDFVRALGDGPQRLSDHLRSLADRLHRSVVLRIRSLPKPVIASIQGVAAGGGFSMTLACDLRIASQDARLFMAYANIGATGDGGSTYFLPRLVGTGRAMEAYMMNQPISAPRALEMGLVNLVVPADELEQHTREVAQRLASGPTHAYGRMKALMDRAWDSDLASQLDEETRAISDAALTGDFQEGITAFVEKRAPKFRGE